jgi:hypothetical protein
MTTPLPTIANGCNRPINVQTGTVPDVSGALKDWFQLLTFTPVLKTTTAFQVLEVGNPQNFWGLVTPYTPRNMAILPEGERAWTYLRILAEPVLTLQVDDVIVFLGKQTRIMSRNDFKLEGFVEYKAIQDWTGAGPE